MHNNIILSLSFSFSLLFDPQFQEPHHLFLFIYVFFMHKTRNGELNLTHTNDRTLRYHFVKILLAYFSRRSRERRDKEIKNTEFIQKVSLFLFSLALFYPRHLLHKYASSIFTKWDQSVLSLVCVRFTSQIVSLILTETIWFQNNPKQ